MHMLDSLRQCVPNVGRVHTEWLYTQVFSIGYNLISSTLSHYRDYYTLREYIATCTKQTDHIANSYVATMV